MLRTALQGRSGRAAIAIAAAAAGTLAISPAGLAASGAKVALRPATGAKAAGTATLSDAGGGTQVAFVVRNLAAGSHVRATLTPGTCARAGARSASIGSATADASGLAHWSAAVSLHGRPVALDRILSHGPLAVRVLVGKRTVACGLTPRGG